MYVIPVAARSIISGVYPDLAIEPSEDSKVIHICSGLPSCAKPLTVRVFVKEPDAS